jgi:hypothetical protein
MCSEKERHVLLNINRLLIYSFGLIGLFYDLTWAYIVSMTLWVWLPNCIRLERILVDRSKDFFKLSISDLYKDTTNEDSRPDHREL